MRVNFKLKIIIGFLFAVLFGEVVTAAAMQDHAILSRVKNSTIEAYSSFEFSSFSFYKKDYNKLKKVVVEGRLTEIFYKLKEETTALALARNIKNSLSQSGFEMQTQLSDDQVKEIKNDLEKIVVNKAPVLIVLSPEYLYMTRQTESGMQHVAVIISSLNDDHYIYYLIMEQQQQKLTPLDVSSGDVEQSIKANGKVAMYGIYFDVGKSAVKPESSAALNSISEVLKANKDLKLYVVGHTDNTGDLKNNMMLSELRAKAVLKKLVSDYGVDEKRLNAFGVASLSPVSANASEFGRAKNRRVELVEQ